MPRHRRASWGKGCRLAFPARHAGRLYRFPLYRRGIPEADVFVARAGAWPIGRKRHLSVVRGFGLRLSIAA